MLFMIKSNKAKTQKIRTIFINNKGCNIGKEGYDEKEIFFNNNRDINTYFFQ